MNRYVIYLRKSRTDIDAEARGEGETLARHERTLIELAKRLKLNVAEIYKEIVSGESIAARPLMQRLLTEVEHGIWSGVLVMEVERLARGDTIDQGIMAQTFKYSDTKIITPMKTYEPKNEFDEEYFEFGLFMSRREYKTINRRLQRGRLASAKEGKYVGNIPPYGYMRKKLEHNNGFTLEPNPEESEIVKLIYELYILGERLPDGSFKRLGVSLIARKLNMLKIKPRKTDTWVTSTIRDILINPVYNGKIRWNWRPINKKVENGEMRIERPRAAAKDCLIIDGLHEALIDDETWNRAQELIKLTPPHSSPSVYQLKNPLSGIVFCGKCGRRMVRRPHSSKMTDTLMCPAASCENVSSRLSIVESHILQALAKWLCNHKIDWSGAAKKKPESIQAEVKKRSLKKLVEGIKTLEKQMENLHDLLEQGIYSSETFSERSKLLSEKINNAKQDEKILSDSIHLETGQAETNIQTIPKPETVLDVYASIDDPKLKNELLKDILEKVVYIKTVNMRWRKSSDEFQIDLFPKVPKPHISSGPP